MDYNEFYRKLFAPVEEIYGPVDEMILAAIIGFEVGGPMRFTTIGSADQNSGKLVTYISCELATREDQVPAADTGYTYEFITTCDSERWVRKIVTSLGHMSLEASLGDGHTVDISEIAEEFKEGDGVSLPPSIAGVLLAEECKSEINSKTFGVLRRVGITRPEMEFSFENGSKALKKRLRIKGIWPNTLVNRKSIV